MFAPADYSLRFYEEIGLEKREEEKLREFMGGGLIFLTLRIFWFVFLRLIFLLDIELKNG